MASTPTQGTDTEPNHTSESAHGSLLSGSQLCLEGRSGLERAPLAVFVGGAGYANPDDRNRHGPESLVRGMQAVGTQGCYLLPQMFYRAGPIRGDSLQTPVECRATLADHCGSQQSVDVLEPGAESTALVSKEEKIAAKSHRSRREGQGQWKAICQDEWQTTSATRHNTSVSESGSAQHQGHPDAQGGRWWECKHPTRRQRRQAPARGFGRLACDKRSRAAGTCQGSPDTVHGGIIEAGGQADARSGQDQDRGEEGDCPDQSRPCSVRDQLGTVHRSIGQNTARTIAREREVSCRTGVGSGGMEPEGGISLHSSHEGCSSHAGAGIRGGGLGCRHADGPRHEGLGRLRGGKSAKGRCWLAAIAAVGQLIGSCEAGPFPIAQTPAGRGTSDSGAKQKRQNGIRGQEEEYRWGFAPSVSPWPSRSGPHGLCEACPLRAGLRHSVIDEDDYVSPFLAQMRALRLHFESLTEDIVEIGKARSQKWILQGPSKQDTPAFHGKLYYEGHVLRPDDRSQGIVSLDVFLPVSTLAVSGAIRSMDGCLDAEPCPHEVVQEVETVLRDDPTSTGDSDANDHRHCDGGVIASHLVQNVQCKEFRDDQASFETDRIGPKSRFPASLGNLDIRGDRPRVRFNFSVDFWFPEAEQITLPRRSHVDRRGSLLSIDPLPSTHVQGPVSCDRSSIGNDVESSTNTQLDAVVAGTSPSWFLGSSFQELSKISCEQDAILSRSAPELRKAGGHSSGDLVGCQLQPDGRCSPNRPFRSNSCIVISLNGLLARDADVGQGYFSDSSHLFQHQCLHTPCDDGGHVGIRPLIIQDIHDGLEGPQVLDAARRKPHSKHAAIRPGSDQQPPANVKNPGLHRPLSAAGHFRVEEPQIDVAFGTIPNPFSSFDAVNGPRVLNAEPEWPSHRYIAEALATAQLPGTPSARFIVHELIDHPGPQIALTQDHGQGRFRAIVFDFRPFDGSVEVIDTPPVATVLQQVQLSRSLGMIGAVMDIISGHACSTLVNGVISAPGQNISPDADVIQFQVWQDGAPTTLWRPFDFGLAGAQPLQEGAAASTTAQTSGTIHLVGATEARPAAVPRYQPAQVIAHESRYTIMDTDIGVQNRLKPLDGGDDDCLQDALMAVPQRGTPLDARFIARPLHGLYLPQVMISRVMQQHGWQTIAIDLRAIGLGIKIANVRLGTSIRQLLAYDSPLRIELVDLGRPDTEFAFLLNLDPCPVDAAFHVNVDSLTFLQAPAAEFGVGTPVLPNFGSHHSAVPSQAAPPRWNRRFSQQGSVDAIQLEEDDRFTVFDTVHHFRVMRRARDDSPETIIARALSSTPELPTAEGHILLHGVAELPFPQVILAPRGSVDCIVPLLYKVGPVSVCTIAVPPRACAFEVAYYAHQSCRALHRAHNQVARRTAIIIGNHGSADPFKPGCAVTHEALVLRGFNSRSNRARGSRQIAAATERSWVAARSHDDRNESQSDSTIKIRVFVTRAHPGAVHVVPTATLSRIAEYVRALSPHHDAFVLRWPTICPAMPGAVPVTLLVTEQAKDESFRWAILDVRRVGHPPLLPFQTIPLPPIIDIGVLLDIVRFELPSLRPVGRAFLNDYSVTGEPTAVDDVVTLTLMATPPAGALDEDLPEPALDINLDLMVQRTALRHQFDRMQENTAVIGDESTVSEGVTDDSTDASASFHSGHVDDDIELSPTLPMPSPITSTTTTQLHPACTTSTTTVAATEGGTWDTTTSTTCAGLSQVTFFVSAGGCRPLPLFSTGTCHLHQIVARQARHLWHNRFLHSMATFFTAQRLYRVPGFGEAAFMSSGNDEQSGQTVWCLSPQWHEPIPILLERFREFGLREVLCKVQWKGAPPPCIAVNGIRWEGLPRFFFSADVIQLAYQPATLQTRPILDLRLRLHEHQCLHFPFTGPKLSELQELDSSQIIPFLEQHFRRQFRARGLPLGPWRPCPHIVIVGHGMPVLRVSIGVPHAPTEALVQQYFDYHLRPHFSCRRIVDTRWASHNAYVFFAAAPWSQACVWITCAPNELDAFELLHDRHSLDSIPAPEGFAYRPAECTGLLGIASLRRINDREYTGPPGFLKCMAYPPYPLPQRPIDLEADRTPYFQVPGTPADPPPISSDESVSPEPLAFEEVEVVSSCESEAALEVASDISSLTSITGDELTSLTAYEVFGTPPEEDSEATQLIQMAVHSKKVLLKNAANSRHVATQASLPGTLGHHIIVHSFDGMFHVDLPANADVHTVNVSFAQLGHQGLAKDIVPLQPMPEGAFHCLSCPRQQHWITVLFRHGGAFTPCSIPQGSKSKSALAQAVPIGFRTMFDGHDVQSLTGLFNGMVIDLVANHDTTVAAMPPAYGEDGVPLQRNAHTWMQPAGPAPVRICNTAVEPDMWSHIFQPLQLHCLQKNWRVIPDLPRVTRDFLSGFPVWEEHVPFDGMQIFVDGSFEQETMQSAWALCVIVRVDGTWQWAGFLSDTTGTPCLDPLEFCCRNAHDAELYADYHALALTVAAGVPCLITYDCESAAGIAQGVRQPGEVNHLTDATLALAHLIAHVRIPIGFCHVKSHQGHPLNELVDRAAKWARVCGVGRFPSDSKNLASAARSGDLQWLWTLFNFGNELPFLDSHGHMCDSHETDNCRTALAPSDFAPPSCRAAGLDKTWQIKAVTYNCLSLKSGLQRELLDSQFHVHRASVVFLQETRSAACSKFFIQHYFGVAGPCHKGQFGCQIWLHKTMSLTVQGEEVTWDPCSLSILHATPRALLVTVCAGRQCFALVAGHGPTAAAPDEEIQHWWRELNAVMRMVPERCILIAGIDANARFDLSAEMPSEECAEGEAAVQLCRLLEQQTLVSSGLFDNTGRRVVTWTSPNGRDACIDYVLVPQELQQGFRTLGAIAGFEDLHDRDHTPLWVEITWTCSVESKKELFKVDVAAIDTPQGRKVMQQILSDIPPIPWELDIDQHLLQLNQHIREALAAHFPFQPSRPRRSHFSAATWEAVRNRRTDKRIMRRAQICKRKIAVHLLFRAWREAAQEGGAGLPGLVLTKDEVRRANGQLAKCDVLVARCMQRVAGLTKEMHRSAKHDTVLEARKRFHEAKHAGPEHIAKHMRHLLRTGRKYKPPSVRPTIFQNNMPVADSARVLGQHFADAERGALCRDIGMLQTRPAVQGHKFVDRTDVPSVGQLVKAFAGLSRRKATGITRIPAEAFICAPLQASRVHFPLILKAYLREQFPLGWRGGQIAAIAKPQKSLHHATGWRSIMLLEASAKGIGRAVRQSLLEGFTTVALPEQGGSRPKVTLEMPMMYTQEVLRRLKKDCRPGGVLFIDGRNAFYATVRQLLYGKDTWDTPEQLQELADLVEPDPERQLQFLSNLLGPGLLQEAGVPSPLRHMIMASMDRTWFTFGEQVFWTKTGTMPGAPLADLTFQFVFSAFLKKAGKELRASRLYTAFFPADQHICLPLPSWMDDLAVPFVSTDAHCLVDVARNAVEVTARCLHEIGIQINTDRGKTEVMLSFQGHGSKTAKRHWVVDNQSRFQACMPNGTKTWVHITASYTHLGSVVSWSGSPVPDIRRRLALALEAAPGVRRHILANDGFRWQEKMHMFSSIVMGRFLHGAGLWVLHTKEHQQAYQTAYMTLVKKAAWPVLGHSAQAIPDDLLCAALGQFSAEVQRRMDILQQLSWISRQDCPFFRRLLLEGTWLPLAIQACHAEPPLDIELPADPTKFLEALHSVRDRVKPAVCRLRQSYRRNAFRDRDAAVEDARFLALGDPIGWVFGSHAGRPAPQGEFTCDVCGLRCTTKSSLASHRSRRHGDKALQVQVASGTECLVCSMQYWTTARLRMHLRKNPTCLAVYAGSDVDFSSEECIVAEKGAWLPAVPSHTPRPWWATLRPSLVEYEPASREMPTRTTPDISHVVAALADSGNAWAPFASACRKLVVEVANFVDSTECVELVDREHPLYTCFAAIISIASHLKSVQSTHGDFAGWSYAVVPPHFCLRKLGARRPAHLPAELATCAAALGGA